MTRTHASSVLIESAKRDAQHMLHISSVALIAALDEVERQASFLACARCLYVRLSANSAVTVINGYALCDDHVGHYDSRSIVMKENP